MQYCMANPPAYTHLRIFRSSRVACNQNTNGDKFASRSRWCVFMGYPYGKKGWKVYDLETHEFFVSWDITFFENQFPFHHTETAPTLSISITEEADLENQIDDKATNQIELSTE